MELTGDLPVISSICHAQAMRFFHVFTAAKVTLYTEQLQQQLN